MNVSTEGTRVYVAPASFNYTNLFQEATLLDTDDYDERTGGLKRPFNSRSDAEPVEPPMQGAAEYNAVEALGPAVEEPHAMCTEQKGSPKRQSRTNGRRKKRRNHEREEEARCTRPDVTDKYIKDAPLMEVAIRYIDLPVSVCGYHGGKDGDEVQPHAGSEGCSVEALLAEGYMEIEWDGVTPEVIVEKETKRIVVILAGRPDDPSYLDSMLRATQAILDAQEAAKFTKEECSHVRADNSAALNVGIYHGGGTKKPGNLNNGRHTDILQGLIANPDLFRMAAFADAGFKLWSPEVYNDVYNVVERLRAHDKKITKNWAALAYPCAAFNFGPQVKCKPHKDSGNSPKTLCAIQAFGKFDPKKGGHLYIRELRLVIRFPAGSTIPIPSALLTHGNTPVGPGEIWLSFTQFVPGGLFRYVDNGFQTEEKLRKKSKRLYHQRMEDKAGQWEADLKKIPTLEQLKEKLNDTRTQLTVANVALA